MTTINNLTIEQMREIVNGAPDWPVIGWCAVGNNYIFKQCEHAPCSYSNLDNAWSEEYAIQFISLDDLRTAIAKHDEFKVGDLVVFVSEKMGFLDDDKVHAISMITENNLLRVCGLYVGFDAVKHATPEEIKAGHRIDDTTDHVTDKVTEI